VEARLEPIYEGFTLAKGHGEVVTSGRSNATDWLTVELSIIGLEDSRDRPMVLIVNLTR
jgi:hypothetical protein